MKILIPFIFFIIPFSSWSSTVLIVIKDHIITIGADSKVVLFVTEVKDKKPVFSIKYTSMCKISKINNFICTGVGVSLETIEKKSPGFLNPNLALRIQLQGLCDYLIPKLFPQIELERRQNRASYIRHFKKTAKKDYFATFCFCCFENGKAVVYTLDFGCINSENEKVRIHSKITRYIEDNKILQLGRTDAIHPLIASGQAFINKSIPQVIYGLIENEIKQYPDFVGEPIDVIEITGQNKYNWVYNSNCKF
ncbi:MAG: hypothetical protein JWQ66_287 [Mucilaginibacter sp.]|nr:hypothetical protein [Mucilaginibacter sp.]